MLVFGGKLGLIGFVLGLFFPRLNNLLFSYCSVSTEVMFIWASGKLGLFCIIKSAGAPKLIKRVRGLVENVKIKVQNAKLWNPDVVGMGVLIVASADMVSSPNLVFTIHYFQGDLKDALYS